jgi:hypothetical protein
MITSGGDTFLTTIAAVPVGLLRWSLGKVHSGYIRL